MTELKMTCEHPKCKSENGQDYFRLKHEQEKGWEDEPIFLCDEHAKGHIPFPNVYPNVISKQNN
jgi:hypothetical protein